jgi:hypothetical protein
MHAGIVIFLTDDASAGPWPILRSVATDGLGMGAPVALRDLAEIGLERAPWWPSPLMRAAAIAELKATAMQCLQDQSPGAGGRFVVHLVGSLSDEGSRRSALRLLPVLAELTRRIALPDELVPVVTSTWLMPAAWNAHEAAELYAWASELGVAGTQPRGGYLFKTIIGRSCRTQSGTAACVSGDEIARVAGQYVVAMQRTSLADRIMELYRGILRGEEAVAIGLDAPDASGSPAILWPGSEHRAAIGPTRCLDIASAAPTGMAVANGAAAAHRGGGFAVATGVRIRALQGYDEWRGRYMTLPLHERIMLHCHPAVQQHASAWDAGSADLEAEPHPEPTPEL